MLIELMEPRRLMSVTAHELPNHILYVKGTRGDDNIQIVQDGGNVFIADNSDPTAPPTIAQNVKLLVVDLGAGDDTVIYEGTDALAIISTGNGMDNVQVSTLGTSQVMLDTAADSDVVSITAGDRSRVTASSGAGDDNISIAVGGQAVVVFNAGSGQDYAVVANSGAAYQVVFNGGSGADTVVIADGFNQILTSHI